MYSLFLIFIILLLHYIHLVNYTETFKPKLTATSLIDLWHREISLRNNHHICFLLRSTAARRGATAAFNFQGFQSFSFRFCLAQDLRVVFAAVTSDVCSHKANGVQIEQAAVAGFTIFGFISSSFGIS